jgi:ADP-dependent NAD(P)H-hydrate dehydratase / NAD(P)H-hydrate epimerase
MQPVLTAAESREFDRYLIEDIGIPSAVLMENAAQGALEAIEDWLEESEDPQIVIFCGPGNNGGDGFALARLLIERNYDPLVFLAGDAGKLGGDALLQYNILSKLDTEVHAFSSFEQVVVLHPDIIVDALLGTGTTGEPHGLILEAMNAIAEFQEYGHPKVLAVDIPTGLSADHGVYEHDAKTLRADRTVTMGAPKIGFYQGIAHEFVGEIMQVQLGAPIPEGKSKAFLVQKEDATEALPVLEYTATKMTRGRVLTVCGSRGMTGAAIMSSTAALRSGCGWVNVAVPKSERSLVAQAMPELLTLGLTEQEDGSPDIAAWDELQEHIEKADAMLIGSGLRPFEGTAELMRKIISEVDLPLVIDAGGLGALVGHIDILKKRKKPTVLTPHVGEIAKLVDRPWKEVERERLEVARQIATTYGVIVVMKGAPTYTVTPNGTAYINTTGNAGLATAGSGDVLAGMIVSLLAQDLDIQLLPSCAAVYLHGLAGDLAAAEKTSHGMTATDVTGMLPLAFKHLGIE